MSEENRPMVCCKDCGRLFMKFSRDICPECREKEQQIIERIVSWVSINPGCDAHDIAIALRIPFRKVVNLVHEGFLRRFGLKMQYPCKICGAKINKGSLCVFCADRLNKVIESLKQSIWQDREIREKIEAAGLRPDLKEEDWEKVACLFSDSIFVKRRDRNVSGRASIPSISLILK